MIIFISMVIIVYSILYFLYRINHDYGEKNIQELSYTTPSLVSITKYNARYEACRGRICPLKPVMFGPTTDPINCSYPFGCIYHEDRGWVP